jgi:hypothetical protein
LKSSTTRSFRAAFRRLPADVQGQCRDAYRLFLVNPRHPSLHFKKIHSVRAVYSARVSRGYRAVCVLDGEEALWFFIGTHAAYDNLIKRL